MVTIEVRLTPEPPRVAVDRYVAAQRSAEFEGLRKSFRSFVFPMTAAFMGWYLLYVVLSAYARDFMGTNVVGNINIALVFGVLQFASTFGIAWLYSRYASRRLDPVSARIRMELELSPRVGGELR